MRTFESVCDYLQREAPADPVVCYRPHAAAAAAAWFVRNFPGDVLYAVKSNPSPVIIDTLYQAGIRHFDVTSPFEIDLLKPYGNAQIFYMNPVKHPAHIRAAYFEDGIRDFSLDTIDELDKILVATDYARDLGLHVRISVDNSRSRMPLAMKYGVRPSHAPDLLRAARLRVERLGVCFHVGSQAMDPNSFARAIERANRAIRKAGVIIDSLDVGGGFPAAYPGIVPAPLEEYMRVIDTAFENSLTSEACRLYCEPGRALVAESASVLVNVTLRKDDLLYINDGAYGSLFDAAHFKFPYPVQAIRDGRIHTTDTAASFGLFGPTCDSVDFMPGPFILPADIRAGDFIEIGQLGAYGETMRSRFNGFGHGERIHVNDPPFMSLFSDTLLPVAEQRR